MKLPAYIIYEDRLRRNFDLIVKVAKLSGAKIIVAFKANAAWRTFPILKEYCCDFAASSGNELQLGREELGGEAHVFTPACTQLNINTLLDGATHITFNSLSQLREFGPLALKRGVSPGLRVNPECSVIETDIYNPALPGSRLGITKEALTDFPQWVEGLHFHALCESSARDLAKVLKAFELKFGHLLPQLKWVNFGGGHLITRDGYDTNELIAIIKAFKARYSGLEVILEPGSAWTWRTGDLMASVVDIVENNGIKTAIIDVSFSCHMPDCLEMPYTPAITECNDKGEYVYKLGGCTCLNGDVCPGEFHFLNELKIGDQLTFEDMNHYTNVKTTMFNGVDHPSMILVKKTGEKELLRQYDYQDYKSRMD